jgi:FMN phosphatase YigB (HAD superfamily)
MWPILTRDDLDLAAPLPVPADLIASEAFVFFDIGGVLIDLDWDAFETAVLALGPTPEDARRGLKSDALRELTRDWARGAVGPAAFASLFLTLLGHSPEEVARRGAPALADVKAASSLIVGPVRARSLRLVKRLRAAGVGVGVLSNAVPWHETDIEATLSLRDVFDVVVFSQDVGFEKPEAGIYEAAEAMACRWSQNRAGRAGRAERAAAPRHVYFVDDLPANVRAARARGWHASLVELVDASLRDAFMDGRIDQTRWTNESRRAVNLLFGDAAALRVEALFAPLTRYVQELAP